VAEGKHERGAGEAPGALQCLVARLLERDAEFVLERLANDNIHVHPGKGRGYFKKAVRWLLEAAKRGYDVLVLVVDEDGYSDRVIQIDEAQESPKAPIPRALGVAVRTFDAWMLADERALSNVLAVKVPRQPEIERIRDPKGACKRLLAQSGRSMSPTELRAAVSREATISVLIERCPTGFRPFAERVGALAGVAGSDG